MSKSLNKADRVLIAAFLLFLLAFWLHFKLSTVMTAALLFIAEASLVGGIADWFAVTALFKKPLGFPYHTAILPKRRAEFTAAVVKLITDDILSPRRLIKTAAAPAWQDNIALYLDTPAVKSAAAESIENFLAAKIAGVDLKQPQETAAAKIQAVLNEITAAEAISYLKNSLTTGGAQAIIIAAAQYAKKFTADPDFEKNTAEYLCSLVEKPELKPIVAMVSRFLDFKLIADYDEAAHLIKLRLNALCDEVGSATPTQAKIQAELIDAVESLAGVESFLADFTKAKAAIVSSLPIDAALAEILQNSRNAIDNDKMLPALAAELAEAFCRNLKYAPATADFLADLIKHAAFSGRNLAAKTAVAAIGKLSDDDLNEIVYGKVEPDLLWIRMNGSIVGAIIGVLLFIIFELLPRHGNL